MMGETGITKFDKGDENIDVEVTVAIRPEIALGDYAKLVPAYKTPKITAAVVKERVDELAMQQAELVTIEEDRALESGDTVLMDFEGSIDGGIKTFFLSVMAKIKSEDTTRKTIRETIEEGFNLLGGFGNLRSPVLVKPNLCTIKDGTGYSVTDTEVVKTIVDLLLETDSKLSIKIIESDSQSKNAEEAFVKFGYTKFCQGQQDSGFDVTTVELSRLPLSQISFDGEYFKDPELPDILTSPHYFISVAVAKTHGLSYITGVLKNLFGVLPRKDMSVYHKQIHEIITDLARILRPELNIVDARVGVEDWNGPKTHRIGAFILGRQPVSVDATMTRIFDLDPLNVGHLVKSRKHNLGVLDPLVIGESIEDASVKFSPP